MAAGAAATGRAGTAGAGVRPLVPCQPASSALHASCAAGTGPVTARRDQGPACEQSIAVAVAVGRWWPSTLPFLPNSIPSPSAGAPSLVPLGQCQPGISDPLEQGPRLPWLLQRLILCLCRHQRCQRLGPPWWETTCARLATPPRSPTVAAVAAVGPPTPPPPPSPPIRSPPDMLSGAQIRSQNLVHAVSSTRILFCLSHLPVWDEG